MSGKNRLFKSGKTIRLWWDFCRSRISAGFGKSAGFKAELEPKSGTALIFSSLILALLLLWPKLIKTVSVGLYNKQTQDKHSTLHSTLSYELLTGDNRNI